MDDALPAADTKTSPPTTTAPPSRTSTAASEPLRASTPSTADNSRHVADMDRPPPPPTGAMYDNTPTTPKGLISPKGMSVTDVCEGDVDSRASTFRGPGGSPILERMSPIQHRPYASSGGSSIGDRRESSSVSPTLTRQDNHPNVLRMLPPPSPPTQRHQGSYTGMDLPPLSSLTSGLPHRPPSSGSMSISSMLGGSSSSNDMGIHSLHHHHPPPPPPPPPAPHHHHHRPPRPYTPEYGNPLAPGASSASSNPLAPRSQSTPTTPALGYPETDTSGHGRSSSYGRMPSNQGVLPAPFRDSPYRGYMNREPMPHQRDEFPPRRDVMGMEQPPSPQPSHQYLQDLSKQGSQYSHQGKHSALNSGIPPPAPHRHQQPPQQQSQQQYQQQQQQQQHQHQHQQHQQHQQQQQQQQQQHSQPPRPTTNGSSSRGHHHHHHRPPSSQPIARQPPPPQSRPPPKVVVNNAPALDVVANINPKPFLGRFIYEPGWIIPESVTEGNLGGHFEVRIPYRFLSRDNEGVVRRKLWGTGVYTDDSDVVAGTSSSLSKY